MIIGKQNIDTKLKTKHFVLGSQLFDLKKML